MPRKPGRPTASAKQHSQATQPSRYVGGSGRYQSAREHSQPIGNKAQSFPSSHHAFPPLLPFLCSRRSQALPCSVERKASATTYPDSPRPLPLPVRSGSVTAWKVSGKRSSLPARPIWLAFATVSEKCGEYEVVCARSSCFPFRSMLESWSILLSCDISSPLVRHQPPPFPAHTIPPTHYPPFHCRPPRSQSGSFLLELRVWRLRSKSRWEPHTLSAMC